VIPRIASENSVDSWDFPATPLASPPRKCLSGDYFNTTIDMEKLNVSFPPSEAEGMPTVFGFPQRGDWDIF
jgi:hypothetical protein